MRPLVIGCRLPQNAKLSGVITTATAVDSALTLTDSAVLPRAWCTRKLEMCPAGQDDTRIMPSAMLGKGCSTHTSTYVIAGNKRWWPTSPSASALGVLSASLKSSTFSSSATPNITSPSTALSTVSVCGLKLSCTWSIGAIGFVSWSSKRGGPRRAVPVTSGFRAL